MGRQKRTRKARIFPLRAAVTPGRTRSTTIMLMLKNMSRGRNETGAVT
jgi:hypothetical protein